eukprot:363567-Chlamydomonas_euryale.AAC.3
MRSAAAHVKATAAAGGAPMDPCLPSGYTAPDGRVGVGGFGKCVDVVLQMLGDRCGGRAVAEAESGGVHNSANVTRSSRGGTEQQRGGEGGGRSAAGDRVRPRACHLDGVPVPPLSGRFFAVENFFWTARALELPPVPSVQVQGSRCMRPHAEGVSPSLPCTSSASP